MEKISDVVYVLFLAIRSQCYYTFTLQIPLGIIPKDESCNEDMVSIMELLQEYSPSVKDR